MAAPKAPMLDALGQEGEGRHARRGRLRGRREVAPRPRGGAGRGGRRARRHAGGQEPRAWSPAAAPSRGARRAPAAPARARPARRSGRAAASPSRRSRASFDLKVNRKVRRAAFRAALSDHAQRGTLGRRSTAAPSTSPRRAAPPRCSPPGARTCRSLVVAQPEEETLVKTFRNLDRGRSSSSRPSSRSARSSGPARCSPPRAPLERVTEVNSQ